MNLRWNLKFLIEFGGKNYLLGILSLEKKISTQSIDIPIIIHASPNLD